MEMGELANELLTKLEILFEVHQICFRKIIRDIRLYHGSCCKGDIDY